MYHYKIADIHWKITEIAPRYQTLLNKYIVQQMTMHLIKLEGADLQTQNIEGSEIIHFYGQTLSFEFYQYITTGLAFARALLDFNGFCLHSSAIAVDNKAVLFAAKSGTGKSTHTRLWREYFGEDKAIMINDDKPAIRLMEDGVFYAYGTPWSGKTDLNTNVKVPLAAIVLLERSDTNWIEPVNRREAVMQIYVHALKPEDGDKDKTIKLMDIVGKTAEKIPVYRMGCTISEEAVKLAYEATILGKIRK